MEKVNLTEIRKKYNASSRRIVFLSYEGVLVSDDQCMTDRAIEELVSELSNDLRNEIVIFSGREVSALEDLFRGLRVTLVAENGGFMREFNGSWQILGDLYILWKQPVVSALQRLALSYPDSRIVEKHFSVKWIYNDSTSPLEVNDRKQLDVSLRMLSRQFNATLTLTDEFAQFQTPEISKAKFAASWLTKRGHSDFIMAIGNTPADEELFELIGKNYSTIKIGENSSVARYFLESRVQVLSLLDELATISLNQN